MPELPEVETTKKGLIPLIINNLITKVYIRNNKLRWPISQHIITALDNKKIHNITRRGKYLLFHLKDGMLIIHLGMSGSIKVIASSADIKKHDHFEICFVNNTSMRLNDPRRFGAVLWSNDNTHPLLDNLGIEPLSIKFIGSYLAKKAQSRQCSIKAFIMNSKIVTGIGNIYACESLYMAGICPQQKANNISKKKYTLLTKHIKQILTKSIKAGGTTLKNFSNVDGNPGYFSQTLSVYGLNGKKCRKCSGLIKKITQNQRSTFYCPTCQT